MTAHPEPPDSPAVVSRAVVLPEPAAWLYIKKSNGFKAATTKRMGSDLAGADEYDESPLHTADQLRAAVLAERAESARVLRVARDALERVTIQPADGDGLCWLQVKGHQGQQAAFNLGSAGRFSAGVAEVVGGELRAALAVITEHLGEKS